MRLCILLEQTGNPYKKYIDLVMRTILEGDSQLKDAINNGLTYEQIVYAIQHGKCVSKDPRHQQPYEMGDVGSTYLEQIIGNIIRDLAKSNKVKSRDINFFRALFYLPPIQEKDPKKEMIHKFQQWRSSQQQLASQIGMIK